MIIKYPVFLYSRDLYCSDEQESNYTKEAIHNDLPHSKLTSKLSRTKHTCSDNGSEYLNGEMIDSSLIGDLDWQGRAVNESPVWCMDFCNDLIILGCADGRLEIWDANSGKLKVS